MSRGRDAPDRAAARLVLRLLDRDVPDVCRTRDCKPSLVHEGGEGDMTASERDLRKHLTDLTTAVRNYLVSIDQAMTRPESKERGQEIARLSNALEMANDRARFFGLDIDYRTGKKRQKAVKAR